MAVRVSAAVKPYMLPEADRHVVSRFSFGVDETLVREVKALGSASVWFERQLNPSVIDDSAADEIVSWYPRLAHDPATAFAMTRNGSAGVWDYGSAFINHWMAHAMVSRRHVHGVMSSFWSNFLYIPTAEDRSFHFRFAYDQVIRRYALTSFRQLLRACVVHPAMSTWLNNNENTNKGINENLGRELLELFTVGRAPGFDEAAVKDCARLLTGFRTKDADVIRAFYDPSKHWTGPVKIGTFRHANAAADGRPAVNELLDFLALHPATAQRVADRLCRRFVGDAPPPAIVSTVAAAYRRSGSDIATTLRALVNHPQFSVMRRSQLRTPVEDVIATARVLNMKPRSAADSTKSLSQQTIWMAGDAGQAVFRWMRPDGFPENSVAYASPARMLQSWSFHRVLAGNAWNADVSRPAPASYLPTVWPRRLDELVEHQCRLLLGCPAPAALTTAVAGILGKRPSDTFASARSLTDRQLTVIRGAVLNIPQGMTK